MTPKERHESFFAGQPVDRPLVQPLLMLLSARMSEIPYRSYVTDGRQLAWAQLKSAELGKLDLLSACSDPVRELSDLGGSVVWFDDEPPMPDPQGALLSDPAVLAGLKVPDPWSGPRMRDRIEGIREMKKAGDGRYPVLGWVEGPSSLAAGLREINTLMEDFFDDPDFVADLMDFCTRTACAFAVAQVEAGADMIGMGDAPSSLIGPDLYRQHVLPGEKRIIRAVHDAGGTVRLHICGNSSRLAALTGESGADLVDFDYPVTFTEACSACQGPKGILGNLDPVRTVKNGSPEGIIAALEECFAADASRYVAGAGCEVPAGTPLPNLLAFHEFSVRHSLP